ncbi:MAG: phosphoglycerate dehydrogenase, partial [Sulfobacillus benefaciens]
MLLITEWTTESSLKWLDRQGIVYHYAPEGHRHLETLSEPLKSAVALVVRNQTPVTSELLAQAPSLKAIGRLGVGLDNINLKACQERGIPVLTARGANAPAVVEYVLGALLRHSRPLPLEMGQWQRHPGGAELHQQHIGVVGFGDIGRRIADVLWMLGATLWVYDPRLGPYDPAVSSHKVRRVLDLETLL